LIYALRHLASADQCYSPLLRFAGCFWKLQNDIGWRNLRGEFFGEFRPKFDVRFRPSVKDDKSGVCIKVELLRLSGCGVAALSAPPQRIKVQNNGGGDADGGFRAFEKVGGEAGRLKHTEGGWA
jgi:hypothetical protein